MDALKESITQMSLLFNQKFVEFEDKQQKSTGQPSASQGNLTAEFAAFKNFVLNALRALQSQVDLLAMQFDNLETHSRRKILLLHGVPEDKNEDTVAAIVKVVSQNLKLSDFQAKDISRCHRMGGSPSKDRPRPILFKVREVSIRASVWSAKTKLKGSGITMSEFLTKARHDIFMAARKRFGVAKCWTRDGSVFVLGLDGVRHRISSAADLDGIKMQAGQAGPVSEAGSAVTLKVPPAYERSKRQPKSKSK